MKPPRRAIRDSVIAAAIFSVLGFATALAVFWNAPRIWAGTSTAGLAAGLAGCVGWIALCAAWPRPAWWRVIIAGIIGGIAVHPFYFLLASIVQGPWMLP